MGAPVSAQKAEHLGCEGRRSKCEQSFPTTSDVAGLFLVSVEGSARPIRMWLLALDTGATADSVYCYWLQRQNRLLGKKGRQKVSTYPASARGRFGDGRLGDVRHAADIPACISGSQGNFAAFALDADIAEFLRKGALEALGGQLDFLRDLFTLRKHGVTIPARVNGAGRYLLGAVVFLADAPRRVRGPCGFALRLRTNARVSLIDDFMCPTRRMARISLNPFARSRPVGRLPWGMRRTVALRTPKRLS